MRDFIEHLNKSFITLTHLNFRSKVEMDDSQFPKEIQIFVTPYETGYHYPLAILFICK